MVWPPHFGEMRAGCTAHTELERPCREGLPIHLSECPTMSTAALSFTLHPVRTEQDLLDACEVRSEAYGRHQPDWRESFAQPETIDRRSGTTVLLCRDKLSGQAVATARLQTSAAGPLQIEGSLMLPAPLSQQPRAEITRLSVLPGVDMTARLALFKASYLLGLSQGVRWLVIGARKPALIRIYQRLGFDDVLGADRLVPLAHAGGLPHRILSFDLQGARAAWQHQQHPLLDFMVGTEHPDIVLPLPTPIAA